MKKLIVSAMLVTAFTATTANASTAKPVKVIGDQAQMSASLFGTDNSYGVSLNVAKPLGLGVASASIAKHFSGESSGFLGSQSKANKDLNDFRFNAQYAGVLFPSLTGENFFVGYNVAYTDKLSMSDTATVRDAFTLGLHAGYKFNENWMVSAGQSIGVADTVNHAHASHADLSFNDVPGSVDKKERVDVTSASLAYVNLDYGITTRLSVNRVQDQKSYDHTETNLTLSKAF